MITGSDFIGVSVRFQNSSQFINVANCSTISLIKLSCYIPDSSNLGSSFLVAVLNDGGYNWVIASQRMVVNVSRTHLVVRPLNNQSAQNVPAGDYVVGSLPAVMPCTAGFYCPFDNNIVPKLYPPGTFDNGTRRKSCSPCPRGYWSGVSSPVICTAGLYVALFALSLMAILVG